MTDHAEWSFYGRQNELDSLLEILARRRWFFLRLSGRRRIGKTTLIHHALKRAGSPPAFYVQIPDSAPAGVLSAVADTLRIFGFSSDDTPAPKTLAELADLVGVLARRGHIVIFDEFQYFNRSHLREFNSELQRVVDGLARDASNVPGGLVVLGSIHADLVALIEDRKAPLFNRTTDDLELAHLDIASVLAILRAHADTSPARLLMLWNLFEGVPKFYRDAYEQDALAGDRLDILRKMFFRSSSPLRSEAEHWFLNELRGRYDVVLKYVARNPGCTHADLLAHVAEVSRDGKEQVSGYLQALCERFALIEKRLPIFAEARARKNRYYIRDNFLRSWLSALGPSVQAVNFRPVDVLLEQANRELQSVEGFGFERLVGTLYEERSRKGIGDFALTERISGYWNRSDVEIDLIALNSDDKTIRFGSCKRSAERLLDDRNKFRAHVQRFLESERKFAGWKIEQVMLSPELSAQQRTILTGEGMLAQDLNDLCQNL
jgi:AAA+ ATPase superfamily predicted ATPase